MRDPVGYRCWDEAWKRYAAKHKAVKVTGKCCATCGLFHVKMKFGNRMCFCKYGYIIADTRRHVCRHWIKQGKDYVEYANAVVFVNKSDAESVARDIRKTIQEEKRASKRTEY